MSHISEEAFVKAAKTLSCEVAAIKAVAEVESGGAGFVDGQPIILFEPHVFWRELLERGIDPNKYLPAYSAVLYRKWGAKPYPKGRLSYRNYENHKRLAKAVEINRDAALESASWGRFQLMGFNYRRCGVNTIQDFINAIYNSDDEHLRLFVNFIINSRLDDELRERKWAKFAYNYNGEGYKKNGYDIKMEDAYEKYSKVK